MANRVQDKKPRRGKDARAWLEENIAEQKRRYKKIVREMDDLGPTRARWYKEFLDICQTRGTNVTGDMRRKISKAEVPKKPNRKDRVIF